MPPDSLGGMASGPAPTGTGFDFDPECRFVRARESLSRQLAGVVLVRTVADPEVVELWGTGVLLWAALVEPATAEELVADLTAVVGAPPDVVARDVRNALGDLVRRGVVTCSG